MEPKVEFELVSPERVVISEAAEMVVVPGSEGDFGVLRGHAPFVTTVRPGLVDVYDEGRVAERVFVSGGFAEVTQERCTVLVSEAVPLDALKREEIEATVRDLREDLEDAADEAELHDVQARLAVAEAKLFVVTQASGR